MIKNYTEEKNTPKGFLYNLDIASDSMYGDSLNLGLSQAKSNIIKYSNVPKEYSNHFIRGVFDGDGSVCFNNDRKNRITVSWVSGSETFLNSLQSTINDELQNDSCKRYICKRRKSQTKESYQIKLLAQKQVYRFFKFLYRDSDKSMYLERKRKIFDVWVENSEDCYKDSAERQLKLPL